MKGITIIQDTDISYLEDILLKDGELQVVPYEKIKDIPLAHIQLFGHKHSCYCIPTQELIDFIQNEIGGKAAIEIGSGNGVVAKALDIPATDNMMQTRPEVAALYDAFMQPRVVYGKDVKPYDAMEAVRKYKPHTVLACWVTHLYNPKEHWREGNVLGVDEVKLFNKVKKYIFVGNEFTHRDKPILDLGHRTIKADWIVSRAVEPKKNVIWIWDERG